MDDSALRARLTFLEELVRELYRQDIVTDEMLGTVAERLAAKATNHGPTEAGVLEDAAHMANMVPFEASETVETESDRRAAFQRRQMRERTAMISGPDGGNPDT